MQEEITGYAETDIVQYPLLSNIISRRFGPMSRRPTRRVTSHKAASKAAKVLSNRNASKKAKSAGASALTQRPDKGKKTNKEVTSKAVASKAAKVLRNPKASKAAKSGAGSALSQRQKRSR